MDIEKIEAITQEEWLQCNEYNRKITDEFLRNSIQLSPKTIDSYRSNLMIWFNYVKQNLDNKSQTDIKSRDYMFFQNWLINLEHSSSDITNKRAAISSLNNYIVMFYSDVYPLFRNFIIRGMPRPEKSFVREKKPLTKVEYENLIIELEKREELQKIAWLKFSYDTGCRRAESRQLLREVIDSKPIIKTKLIENDDGNEEIKTIKYYQTHKIRCKGRGKQGKIRRLKFSQDTMDAIKKWLQIRDIDSCPYVFVAKDSKSVNQISESALNVWCSGLFAEIVGRRVHPHLLRESRATTGVVEEGKDIKTLQKLLGHADSATTEIYVIREDDEDDIDELFE